MAFEVRSEGSQEMSCADIWSKVHSRQRVSRCMRPQGTNILGNVQEQAREQGGE